ncbi:DNA-processing protein DprA [Deferrisoma camini]|uniref:DNA-processing protein DprA n=1 Tax=Deferrisoma camini TaxID=1035120 RepID=UPI00046CCF44|nr:DNA-processing protein DprA [Deferrisoma camini]
MDRTWNEDRAVEALVLRSAQGVGDRAFRLLVDAFGSPGAVLAAKPAELAERCAATPRLIESLARARRHRAWAEAQVAWARRIGVGVWVYGAPGYPIRLRQIPNPPSVLFAAGPLDPDERPAVAVVGSRRASEHGRRFARRLGRELAEAGVVVVSGMARGIDSAAHWGALEAGGTTVAVFGWGLDHVPRGWARDLAARIRQQGVCISEFPLGVEARPAHFPRRNRVISALSLGVVVVEAAPGSGSLITASLALEQGREVFAVPGVPGMPNTRGTHELIRQGARLVEGVDDILAELGPAVRPAREGGAPGGGQEPPPRLRPLWQALGPEPEHVDAILARAGWSASEGAAGLMELALAGLAEEWPGRRYCRAGGRKGT